MDFYNLFKILFFKLQILFYKTIDILKNKIKKIQRQPLMLNLVIYSL